MRIFALIPKSKKRLLFAFSGIEYVAEILTEAGYSVNRVHTLEQVGEGDLVLNSLTDSCDAYVVFHLYEEVKKRGAKLFVGGQRWRTGVGEPQH